MELITTRLNISEESADTIAYYLAMFPGWNARFLCAKLEQASIALAEKDVPLARALMKDQIRDYRQGGNRSLKKAMELGSIKYLTKHERVEALSRIADEGLEGFDEDRATAKGDVVTVRVKNHAAATSAIKLIDEWMSADDEADEYTTAFYEEMPGEEYVGTRPTYTLPEVAGG